MFETSEQAIAAFDKASKMDFTKRMFAVAAEKSFDLGKEKDEVLKKMYKEGRGYEVIAIIEDYAILKYLFGGDKTYMEYPYTSSVKTEEGWKPTCHCFTNLEEVMLFMIGYKKEGSNTRFHQYAYKSLG